MSITSGSERIFHRTGITGKRFVSPRHWRAQWRMLLQQGMTPQSLAAGLALGATIGILPTIWGTSLICIGLAGAFRLNHLATQFANYAVYPLQVILFIPYFLLGRLVAPNFFGHLSKTQWLEISGNWPEASSLLFPYLTCAITGWLVTAPATAALVYLLTKILLNIRPNKSERNTLTET